ncbi:DUF6882 domain-containing protein [Nocardia camponoti]|uniref:Uncharacterized protein n=1 Tax=Nocardia camponoti TaxID=1616106 RepID=A0A917QAN9_9NOCA|nr:DUF6882 domain-containing protein [Nocardia camponoti]GGK40298.1 hypothetical protein GCM10011591_09920 [Nocardia camponoti]
MSEVTLTNLLDDAALLSLEYQLRLSEVASGRPFSVDLAGGGQFSFTGDQPLVADRVHLLGSAAPGPRSWLWAWANPSGYSAEVTALAQSVREFGKEHGIAELSEPEVPFDALPGAPTDPVRVVTLLTDAAKVITGKWTSYNAPVGRGSRASLVIEHPSFALPAPTGPHLATILEQGIAALPLYDQRRAVHSYALKRGLTPSWNPDWSHLTIPGPDFEATLTFDQNARTQSINVKSA